MPNRRFGAVEHRRRHRVEREVRHHLGVAQPVVRLPHLLGPVAPVPALDRRGLAVLARQRRRAPSPRPPRAPWPAPRPVRAGRPPRAACAPCGRRARSRRSWRSRAGAPARGAGAGSRRPAGGCRWRPHARRATTRRFRLLAQVTSLRTGQERLDRRHRQRDDPGVGEPAVDRRLPRRVAQPAPASPARSASVEQDQLEPGLVGEHVLRELRRQRREPLDDRGVALLRCRREPRPGADEVEVHAFEQPRCSGSSPSASRRACSASMRANSAAFM